MSNLKNRVVPWLAVIALSGALGLARAEESAIDRATAATQRAAEKTGAGLKKAAKNTDAWVRRAAKKTEAGLDRAAATVGIGDAQKPGPRSGS